MVIIKSRRTYDTKDNLIKHKNWIICTKLFSGTPIRASGKVNIDINGVKINQQDLQAYIVVADGRPYTAISKIPITMGRNLQALYSITAVLNWLFAVPTGSGLNGFQITGEIIKLGLQKVRKKLKFVKVEMISCFRGCTKSHGRNYIQRDK